MKTYAAPETITAESFEVLEQSVKENFCSKCYDRKCEQCSVRRLLDQMKEKVK